MNQLKNKRPLPDTATDIERKYYIANLKHNYGLRKALSEIKHSIDELKIKLDLKYAGQKYL